MTKHMKIDHSTAHPVAKAGVGRRVLAAGMAAMPWMIIGGLLWAGLFIKPQAAGSSVTPPALERRDHFFGLAIGSANEVLAAGSSGKILSIDAAGAITRLATPTDKALQDIAVWPSGRAVAVGNDGVVLYSADGRHWEASSAVPRSEVANKLNRVRLAGEGVAIATGEMGALLVSRDHGQSWQRLREEEDVAWNDVAVLPDGRLVVVGEFGRILLGDPQWQGWQELESPLGSSLMSVSFRDGLHGAAVGLDGVLLLTGDGGQSWQTADLGIAEHLFEVIWDAPRQRWFATGALGRWVAGDSGDWHSGALDERNLAWHTRALLAGSSLWLAGADIGRWDGQRWSPLAP
jgi:photosystem II stability/assembly factor-like uncharacterized protein